MIVISGALVVVAIVLLAIGIFSSTLGFVYASIAGSVVAFAFLIIGVLQRRGEEVPQPAAGSPAPALASSSDVEGVTAIIPASARSLPSEADRPAAAAASGSVLVVEGRPRYHVAGCRYLTGKDAAEVAVSKARADGFTACGVCKPDEALTAAPVSLAKDEPVAAARETTRRAPARTAVKAPATKAAETATPVKAAKTTAKKAPAKTAAKKAAAPAKTAAKAPAKKAAAKTTAAKAPAKKAPAKKAPAKKAAARR